ncbi:MAG: T9SS type A sorting domain-containing protein [Bacteroidales bacterium]|nr:T9SS type A sorting domain-containing protein [Bacteroidales bacterium]
MKSKILGLVLFVNAVFFFSAPVFSQVTVNAYAKVSSISGSTINVINVNESNDLFEVGDDFFIMQMQDDVIGSNTADNSNFGNLNSIENAGLFTRYTISSVNRSSGLTSITVTDNTWLSLYTISANTSVQVISFPVLGGGGSFTTSSDYSCLAWDGNIGGVLAFDVGGDLTLLNDINVDGKGFRGGSVDGGSSGSCNASIYRISTTGNYYADKGEGIYKNTNSDYVSGRGHILSGGGGGNSHNAGGAGGGNGSVGGDGGFGWQCNPTAGGIGGLDLSNYIATNRVFLGGGGGAGEGNNNVATPGGNGGGIILISADKIITTSSCSGVNISSNGNNGPDCSANDGAGGGGAGGCIILNVDLYTIDANCSLTVKANGGTGGAVSHTAEHGGGGGGGMGKIIYSASDHSSVGDEVGSGDGGDSGGGNDNPGSGGSTSPDDGDDGIEDGDDSGPLPVSLLSFNTNTIDNYVLINWTTASETNNMGFDVQVSYDNINWNRIGFVKGNGNSNQIINYEKIDRNPVNGTNYYRLKQMDYDGKYEYSEVISAVMSKKIPIVFNYTPNPAKDIVFVKHNISSRYSISIFSIDGKKMLEMNMDVDDTSIDISNLPVGIYTISVLTKHDIKNYKLVIN